MQMKALRSANFAKLSSSSSTSEEYCVVSISAGTPGGYCLSQTRSMVFPSKVWSVFFRRTDDLREHWSMPPLMASGRGGGRRVGSRAFRRNERCGRGTRQPAGLLPVELLLGAAFGLAADFGAAGLPGAVAGFAAVSGLALACLTAAGCLPSGFACAAASLLAPTRGRLPRRVIWLSESAATAATSAAPVRVGPV